MKKKITKILGLGLLAVILVLPVSAVNQSKQIVMAQFEKTIALTALDIQMAKAEQTIAKLKLDNAKKNQDAGAQTRIETDKNKGYNVKQAQMNYDYARWQTMTVTNRVVLDGKQKLFTYLLNQDKLALYQQQRARLQKEEADLNRKLDQGLTIKSKILDKKLEIKQVEYQQELLGLEQKNLGLDLNSLLLWDLDTTVEITPIQVPTTKFDVKQYEQAVTTGIKVNGDVIKANREYELAKDYVKLLNNISSNQNTPEREAAEKQLANRKVRSQEAKLEAEYAIRSTYNELLNSYDELEIKKLELKNLEYKAEVITKRHDVGLEVLAAVNQTKEAVRFKEWEVKQAELKAYVFGQKFRNLYQTLPD